MPGVTREAGVIHSLTQIFGSAAGPEIRAMHAEASQQRVLREAGEIAGFG